MSRFDNYQWIHKAVRHQMTQVIQQLSGTDWADAAACRDALDAVDTALRSQRDHTRHEETWYHPLLETRAPGSTARFHAQHEEFGLRFAALESSTARLRAESVTGEDEGHVLYLAFCRLCADYLVHLDEEEAVLKPLMLEHFSEPELLELQDRIVADVAPEEMQVIAPHFFAALDRAEMIDWLTQIRQGAPPEVFAGICSNASVAVPPETWEKVAAALGLPASPPAL